MEKKRILLCMTLLLMVISIYGQQNVIIPDLSKCNDPSTWILHNREIHVDKVVHLNGLPGDGLVWIKEPVFKNGKIELDIRGKDIQGRSFVGLAFHGLNESTYDAIYFRPFNFKNPERLGHSVQYISHPEYTWSKLRNDYPEKYENPVIPVPEPTDWFHVTILVDYPDIKVFVNNSDKPSLSVKQLSSRKEGWIGFWVGNNSEGFFKNLRITLEN